MPTYAYKCSSCSLEFEIFHSMSEVVKDCTHCDSKDTLVKQLAKTARVVRSSYSSNAKPGNLVKQYIKDVKEEVKNEKKRLKTQEYKK